MFLGIDLGTSSVKVVLVDADDRVLDQESARLEVGRPQPLWCEQDPETWWRGTEAALSALAARCALGGVRGIGLSGQMHGATLLDERDRVLRPAILWNDGRSEAACRELERRAPQVEQITGNRVMPGFTAPKLIWVAEHEPDVFARVARVLLPKDYLRLRLTGERVAECSDAAGTLWLDVGRRAWSNDLVEATGLRPDAMPRLVEGSEPSAVLRREWAARWGIPVDAVVAGGAGDQAAGAIGAGVVSPGQSFLALGTSGVLFAAGDRFAPNPAQAVHAFCHALPDRWHQMSVILSAASCLAWVTRLTGARDEAAVLAALPPPDTSADALLFLPYLSGERTPHDDPRARGVFFGLTHETDAGALARAVLEGVAFALADGQRALLAAGAQIGEIAVVGGGARSEQWGRILASTLDRPLAYAAEAAVGPALGAARLGRLAATGEDPVVACPAPPIVHRIEPDPTLREIYRARHHHFRKLYPALRELYRPEASAVGARVEPGEGTTS